jgi:putative serine protease PepD
VIKLTDASGLAVMDFADSTKLNVGDTTVAIGAPLGLENTVTTGIISALNRSIQIASSAAPESDGSEDSESTDPDDLFQFDFPGSGGGVGSATISLPVIQTDAAINPGNSGGALLDSNGKLIGINVAIATTGSSTETSGNIGVGFSIPSDLAQRVASEIIENGEATHGLLGANVGDSTTDVAGAYVDAVTPGGAADEAGLTKGDIITEFNGVTVGSASDLTAQVRYLPAGATTDLEYVRDGKTYTVDVTLGELEL